MHSRPSLLITTVIPGFEPQMLPPELECQVTTTGVLSDEDLRRHAVNKDAIACTLVTRISEEFLQSAPNLKMVANIAVGYDNVDVDAATRYGVIVTNTPGVLDDATADLAFTIMLSVARRITEAERFLREGRWKSFELDLLTGAGVFNKTLGVIGFGRIGQAMARRARGFNMKVYYTRRQRVAPKVESECSAEYLPLEQLLEQSDFVSLHCPLTAETKHLINDSRLKMMKPGAFLINTARGAVVDEIALAAALKNKTIAGAALDVFEHEPRVSTELLELSNVVLVPHIGSATTETRKAMAQMALSSAALAFSGQKPTNVVNPEAWSGFLDRIKT